MPSVMRAPSAGSVSRLAFGLACVMLLGMLLAPGLAPAQPGGGATTSTLRITGIESRRSGREGLSVILALSANVDLPELKKHLEFSPPVANVRVEYEPYQDLSYRILGDFLPEKDYRVSLTPGLAETGGAVLRRRLTAQVKTEKLYPSLAFNQEGKFYFPRKSGPPLALESRAVSQAMLKVSRLFPNNVALAVDQLNNGSGSEEFDANWCEELKTTTLKLKGDPWARIKTPIPLASYLDRNARGVFFIQAIEKKANPNLALEGGDEEGDGDWEDYQVHRAGKIVIQTNLGLLAHWQGRELVCFVHDLSSVKPLAMATVTVWSSKNQFLGESHTGFDGIARFNNFRPALGEPKVAVVEHFGDCSLLELKPRPEDEAGQDGSLSPYLGDGCEAFLYADRELYRPGETAHLRWLVRTHTGDAAGSVPLVLNILKPNGKSLLTRPTVLSSLGTGGIDLPTQRTYPTGRYLAQILMPGDEKKVIGSYRFNLEDFVPARMKATVATDSDRWLAGRDYAIKLHGEHLFGGGASGRKAEVQVLLSKGTFAPEKWKRFTFGNETSFKEEKISCGQRTTDKDGNAAFKFNWQPKAGVSTPVQAAVVGKVYELGGRAVTARKEVLLFPAGTCLGLTTSRAARPRSLVVTAAAVQADERPSSLTQAQVSLEQQVWSYNVRRYTSNWEAAWSQSFREIETHPVGLKDGVGATTFTVAGYGYYRLRVHSPATPQYTTVEFYCWGDDCEVIDASQPSLIKLTPLKPAYTVGETAQVRIEAPFDGRAMVVIQGESIQEAMTTEITSGTATVAFKVKEGHFPCVWAQVTAVHSIVRQPMLVSPFSAFAQAPIRVTDPSRKLQVNFPALPQEVKPAQEVGFEVEVLDFQGKPVRQAELTLAAVDEGIHLTTGYRNPDPWAWLTRLRRPDLKRAHYYDKIAYDFDKPAPGGDGDELGKRLSTPGENWIKPLALWSGPLSLDQRGRATVRFTLPEFSGQLRLVAVACSARALGVGAGSVFVRRPVMLQTSQPRFLLPGDLFKGQAVLYNRTPGPVTARLSWSASGALEPTSGTAELPIPSNGEAHRLIDFRASKTIGQGNVRWEAVFLNAAGQETDRITQKTPLPVTPPAAFQSQSEFTLLKPGQSLELRNTKFIEGPNTELELTAGADLQLRLQEALGWVIQYPYGCVEQTTSRLFPLYLLRQSTAVTSSVLAASGRSLDDIVRAGIDRLFSMQTADGGLAYWPGLNHSYPYGSVYALHCLTMIRNGRQVEIPADGFAALQRYVMKLATMQEEHAWYFTDLFQRAYAVSVLTLGGDAAAAQMIENFDSIEMPRPGRYLLAAALAASTRDPERVKKYLATAPMKPWNDRQLGYCLSSPVRNAAIEMLALEEAGTATPEELNSRARYLIDWLAKNHYGSTQETAFVVSALAGYLAGQQGDASKAALTVTDPQGRVSTIKGTEVYHGKAKGPGRVYKVANPGGAEVALTFTTRGLPLKAENAALSHGISIRRAFLREGAVTTATALTFRQTESPVLRLDITVPGALTLENVIVTDLLPAGLEVENPRLTPDAAPALGLKDAIMPSYLELRDDRLVMAFDELKPGLHHVYATVRAVTPGKYQYPAVVAECMYDAAIRGRSAVGTLEVTP